MREYHILHLEDSHSDADMIKRSLVKENLNFQYFLADDKESFIHGLTDFKPDVILCDHALPQFDSVMAFDIYKEMKLEIPFILVTGSVSEEYAVEMIKKGIDDYLLKTNLQRLPQAIKSAFDKRENEKKIRQVEKDLKQSETNLRTIFENTSSGFLLLDKNLNVISFNNQMNYFTKKSFGFDLQENVSLITMFMVERQQEFKNLFSMILKGETISNETSYPQTDGKLIWHSVHANQVCDSNGKVIGICVSVNDITERKKAEDKISESEEIFRRLFNESADSTLLLDDTGFTDCNQSALSILGYASRQEVLNKKPWDISPEKQPDGRLSTEKAEAMMAKALQQGYNHFEWMHKKSDGTEFPVEVMLTPITLKGKQSFYTIWRDITERKKAEQELRKSEAKFRQLMEASTDALIGANKEGKIVYANKEATILFGYTAEELLRSKVEVLLPDRFRGRHEGHRSAYEANPVTREMGKAGLPLYGRRKDGSEFATEISLKSIETEEGLVVLSAIRNITERKQAEEALKLFRTLIDRSNDAIEIIDPETGRFLDVNEKGCQELGYSREEFLGLSIFDIDPRVDQSNFRSIDEELRKSGNLLWEGYHRRKNGSTFPVEVNIKYVQLDRDYIITVARDITERKLAEEKLKESERFLNESQAVSKIGSYVLDFNTGEWKSSHELNNIFGFTANGKHTVDEWISLIHPDHQKMMQEYFTQEVVGKKQRFDKEYKIINKNAGEECWVHGIGDLEFDSIGVPVKMLGTIQDITERKKSELLLKHLNDNLEKKAAELEISNTELEQFAYVASHDLQEPLRMVTSFMNLLEKRMGGQLDDTNKKYIHFAADGAMRMKILIQDLLLYSRVGSNKESFTTTNINDVMQYVNQLLEENIKETAATITVKPMPVISANKTLISQLFVNLITNALKYHGDKQPIIEVGYAEEPGNWIFYVKDNGIGIDPKFFDKIFIIFQRLHNKSEYSGTGIGLAICKKIVEIHKGKIWVESESGKGSIFYFSLPKTKHSA